MNYRRIIFIFIGLWRKHSKCVVFLAGILTIHHFCPNDLLIQFRVAKSVLSIKSIAQAYEQTILQNIVKSLAHLGRVYELRLQIVMRGTERKTRVIGLACTTNSMFKSDSRTLQIMYLL